MERMEGMCTLNIVGQYNSGRGSSGLGSALDSLKGKLPSMLRHTGLELFVEEKNKYCTLHASEGHDTIRRQALVRRLRNIFDQLGGCLERVPNARYTFFLFGPIELRRPRCNPTPSGYYSAVPR